MTKVTWLGDGSGAQENEWNGVVFKLGEAVEVKDEAMVEKAKANKFYKVAGNKAETVEDNPLAPPTVGRPDDLPENIAFAPQERLDAHREASRVAAEQGEERAERAGRRPGRPRKETRGGSETFAERVPPAPKAAPKTGADYGDTVPPPPAAKQF